MGCISFHVTENIIDVSDEIECIKQCWFKHQHRPYDCAYYIL